jgi:hypothetical protein
MALSMRTDSATMPEMFLLLILSTKAIGKLLSFPCSTPIFFIRDKFNVINYLGAGK